jgi:hypothetical protein
MPKLTRPSLSSISSSLTSCCNLHKPCAVRDCRSTIRWKPDEEVRGGSICKQHMKELRIIAAVIIDDWLFVQMVGEGAFGGMRHVERW